MGFLTLFYANYFCGQQANHTSATEPFKSRVLGVGAVTGLKGCCPLLDLPPKGDGSQPAALVAKPNSGSYFFARNGTTTLASHARAGSCCLHGCGPSNRRQK